MGLHSTATIVKVVLAPGKVVRCVAIKVVCLEDADSATKNITP